MSTVMFANPAWKRSRTDATVLSSMAATSSLNVKLTLLTHPAALAIHASALPALPGTGTTARAYLLPSRRRYVRTFRDRRLRKAFVAANVGSCEATLAHAAATKIDDVLVHGSNRSVKASRLMRAALRPVPTARGGGLTSTTPAAISRRAVVA